MGYKIGDVVDFELPHVTRYNATIIEECGNGVYIVEGKNKIKYKVTDKQIDKMVILKTAQDKEIFAEAILNPPEPNEALKKAKKTYDKKINNKK